MPTIHVAGVELFYVEQGSGQLPLVFGHGTLISSNVWRDFYFPHLPPSWHALALDFRGHGRSHAVREGCNFVQMADDVVAVSRQLGLGKFVYVGLSMGGGVGVQLALQHADELRGLVLISPVTGLGPLGNWAFRKLGGLMAGRRWILRLGLRSVSTGKPDPAALERVVDEAAVVSKATLREYLAPANRIQGVERLSSLALPVLVLIGAKDKVIPVEQQHRLAATIPGCRKLVFPEFGHALAAECPDQVLAEISTFVAGLPPFVDRS